MCLYVCILYIRYFSFLIGGVKRVGNSFSVYACIYENVYDFKFIYVRLDTCYVHMYTFSFLSLLKL